MTQHYAMLQRNLLYTGVTRGKKLVVLVGQKKAVAIAVKNVSGRRRGSKLDEWLAQGGVMIEFRRIENDDPVLAFSPLLRGFLKTFAYLAEHGTIGLHHSGPSL
jgi:ATP-dependent exoDNAse (exonuclease V), alpha subunit - helicase superfamily I member